MTGVIIGRFQVPYLHAGHLYIIGSALQEAKKVVIFLGCSQVKDERNPYSVLVRMRMIQKVFPHVIISTLDDVPGDDQKWSDTIDDYLSKIEDPVLIHSRDSFKDHYKGKFLLHELPELPGYSGTELRKQTK